MSDSFTCPFCNHTMPLMRNTYYKQEVNFHIEGGNVFPYNLDSEYCINIRMYRCPSCQKITSFADYSGSELPSKTIPLFPISLAKQFPSYVPEAIRRDYEEACAIVTLSPKSSATLSRRCLQSMIRDFWGVTGKKRLVDEINELQNKVPAKQWEILNCLRRIGNIGAHPEADINLIIDINPDDAQKLISIIELLIRQWYIERHEQEQLFNEITSLDQETQSQRVKE